MSEQQTTGQQQERQLRGSVTNQFQPGQSGNPKGRPRARHTLSRTIQDMLHDEAFDRLAPEQQLNPLRRIVSLAIQEAMDPRAAPDARQNAREWIATHGYGVVE